MSRLAMHSVEATSGSFRETGRALFASQSGLRFSQSMCSQATQDSFDFCTPVDQPVEHTGVVPESPSPAKKRTRRVLAGGSQVDDLAQEFHDTGARGDPPARARVGGQGCNRSRSPLALLGRRRHAVSAVPDSIASHTRCARDGGGRRRAWRGGAAGGSSRAPVRIRAGPCSDGARVASRAAPLRPRHLFAGPRTPCLVPRGYQKNPFLAVVSSAPDAQQRMLSPALRHETAFQRMQAPAAAKQHRTKLSFSATARTSGTGWLPGARSPPPLQRNPRSRAPHRG